MAFVLLALQTARAADSWVGGALSAGGEWIGGVGAVPMQAELDLRVDGPHVAVRIDADLHLQPVDNQEVVTEPYPVEWAMLQLGAGADPVRLRSGITNPAVMLEDQDAWNNPLPTFSLLFGASPGRVLGAEIALHRADGAEAFVWGGTDLDFVGYPPIEGDTIFVPTVGLGIATDQDAFGTWSAIASWPAGERDLEGDAMHGLFGCVQLRHLDPLWIALDGGAGVRGPAPFAGGAVVVEVWPAARVAGVARAEGVIDPGDEALGGAVDGILDGTASLGARVRFHPSVLLQLEVKVLVEHGEVSPGAAVLLTLHRPEPTAPAGEA